jgi:hypothetical protein
MQALIKAGVKNLFFDFDPMPRMYQGGYLTPAPPELLHILDDAYRGTASKSLLDMARNDAQTSIDQGAVSAPTLEELAHATYLTTEELAEIESLLLQRKQLIFEGPPGSGKTYVAEKFARYFTENPLDGDHDMRVVLVQFHQSYGYGAPPK